MDGSVTQDRTPKTVYDETVNLHEDITGLQLPKGGLFDFGHITMTGDVPKRFNGWQIVDFLRIHGQGGDDANREENMRAIMNPGTIVSVFRANGENLVIRTEADRSRTRLFVDRGYVS